MKHVICIYCGKDAELVSGDKLYLHRPDLAHRMFWYCRPCDAWVGTHSNSKDHAPMGTLANSELRTLRREVHRRFDPMWESGRFEKRVDAYRWLAKRMGRTLNGTHVGFFREDDCKLAITILEDVASWPTTLQSPT